MGDVLEKVFLGSVENFESENPFVLPIMPIVEEIAWNNVGKAIEGILVGFGEEFSGSFDSCLNDVE